MHYAIETLIIEQKRLENILRKVEYEENAEPIRQKLKSDIDQIKLAIKLIEPKFGFGRIQKLAEYICQHLDISIQDLRTKSRKDVFLIPKYYLIYVAEKILKMSHESIGDYIDRERSTINHSMKAADDLLRTDESFCAWINFFSDYAETLGKHEISYPPNVEKKETE